MRNAIDQIRNSFMPEGITMSRYPTAHSQQIPTFSLIWISMLHDYWMYRGDANFIRSQLPVARMVLQFFQQFQQKDGSLKNVPYWNFTDWVNDKGWDAGIAPSGKDGTSAALDLQLLMAYQAAVPWKNKPACHHLLICGQNISTSLNKVSGQITGVHRNAFQ
jgi:hypothetical protein